MNFASILPKTSGSARQPVSSRPCSTSPATQPSKQTRPAARTDRRCRSNEKNKQNKKTFPTGQVYCTLTEEGQSSRCGVCDSSQSDKAHPPHLTLDGSDR